MIFRLKKTIFVFGGQTRLLINISLDQHPLIPIYVVDIMTDPILGIFKNCPSYYANRQSPDALRYFFGIFFDFGHFLVLESASQVNLLTFSMISWRQEVQRFYDILCVFYGLFRMG